MRRRQPSAPWHRRERNVGGFNRHCTVLVYLADCSAGGETCWLWTRSTRRGYYRKPRVVFESELNWMTPHQHDVLVQPKEGMAVVHFPSTTLETGGLSDPNAVHEGAPAVDTKYVARAGLHLECAAAQRWK